MQPWRDNWLAHSLPLGFEQTLLEGRLPDSSLVQGASSSVRFVLIVTVNLTDDYLRVIIYYHIRGSCYFGEIQLCYQGIVFCFVICRREIELDHAFDLVPF